MTDNAQEASMTQPIPTLSAEHQAFLAETKARNSIYAGLRMDATESKPAENEEQATEEAGTEETAEEQTVDEVKEELTPEELRELVTKANAEAANYRVKLRNAQTEAAEAVAKATSLEEAQAASAVLQEQVAKLERQVLVSAVAQEHKLPADLAALLQGDDESALKEHAKVLAKYIPKGAPKDPRDLGGGLNPGTEDDGFDPVATARAARKRR